MEQKKTHEVAWPEPSMNVGDVELWDAQAVRELLELHGIRGDSSHVWERDEEHLVELDDDTPVVISAADLRSQLMMKPNVRSFDHWKARALQAEAMIKQLASDTTKFMAPVAWAVVVGGEVHSVRRFEPRATDEPGGAVFVPLFPPSPISQDREGWLREGALVYRLTDERRPCNRDEVSVTMADGSHHDKEARVRLAKKIHEFLAQPEPAFDWDNSQAFSEGWGVFTVDGRFQIQRSDERGYFTTDAMAIIHVALRAHDGSSYHLQALEMFGALAHERKGH